jgi:hypothetical protein
MSGWYWLWNSRNRHAEFYAIGGRHYRCGTVPHTRKFKASGRYFRFPRTMQELRWNKAGGRDEDLCFHKVSLSRRSGLPTAYDDLYASSLENRNWKQFRYTRWKDQGGQRP